MIAEVIQGASVIEPWANLTALGALIAIFVWFVTKGLPAMVKQFTDQLEKQRGDFREETQMARAQSKELAEAGHAAVNGLSASFLQLGESLRADRREGKHHE